MLGFQIMTQQLSSRSFKVSVKGFVDGYTCNKLEEAINKIFGQGIYDLFIDLSGVHYVSCTGVGVLVCALDFAKEHKGNIVLVNPGPNVREILNLLDLSTFFAIDYESAEGLESINLPRDNKAICLSL